MILFLDILAFFLQISLQHGVFFNGDDFPMGHIQAPRNSVGQKQGQLSGAEFVSDATPDWNQIFKYIAGIFWNILMLIYSLAVWHSSGNIII